MRLLAATTIFLFLAVGAHTEEIAATSEVSDLPAWEHQPAESKAARGTLRIGSLACQRPAGEVPCFYLREPGTKEDLQGAGLDFDQLDAKNPLIDLKAVYEATGRVPSHVWFD